MKWTKERFLQKHQTYHIAKSLRSLLIHGERRNLFYERNNSRLNIKYFYLAAHPLQFKIMSEHCITCKGWNSKINEEHLLQYHHNIQKAEKLLKTILEWQKTHGTILGLSNRKQHMLTEKSRVHQCRNWRCYQEERSSW